MASGGGRGDVGPNPQREKRTFLQLSGSAAWSAANGNREQRSGESSQSHQKVSLGRVSGPPL